MTKRLWMRQRKTFITATDTVVSDVFTKDGWDSKTHSVPNPSVFPIGQHYFYSNYILKPV